MLWMPNMYTEQEAYEKDYNMWDEISAEDRQ